MRDTAEEARARGLDIPQAALERAGRVLDALEAEFRPLVKTIPFETEPATVFHCTPGDEAR